TTLFRSAIVKHLALPATPDSFRDYIPGKGHTVLAHQVVIQAFKRQVDVVEPPVGRGTDGGSTQDALDLCTAGAWRHLLDQGCRHEDPVAQVAATERPDLNCDVLKIRRKTLDLPSILILGRASAEQDQTTGQESSGYQG